MDAENMDELLGSLSTLVASAAEFQTISSKFESSLKFMGRPALPPVIIDNQRADLCLLRRQAVHVEAKLKAAASEKLIARVRSVIQDIDTRKVHPESQTSELPTASGDVLDSDRLCKTAPSILQTETSLTDDTSEGTHCDKVNSSVADASELKKSSVLDSGYSTSEPTKQSLCTVADPNLDSINERLADVDEKVDDSTPAVAADVAVASGSTLPKDGDPIFDVSGTPVPSFAVETVADQRQGVGVYEPQKFTSVVKFHLQGYTPEKSVRGSHASDLGIRNSFAEAYRLERRRFSDSFDASRLNRSENPVEEERQVSRPNSAPPLELQDLTRSTERLDTRRSVANDDVAEPESPSLLSKVDLDQHNDTLDDSVAVTPSKMAVGGHASDTEDESDDNNDHLMATVRPGRSLRSKEDFAVDLDQSALGISVVNDTQSTDLAGYLVLSPFDTSVSQVSILPDDIPMHSHAATAVVSKETDVNDNVHAGVLDASVISEQSSFNFPGSHGHYYKPTGGDADVSMTSSLGPRSSYTIFKPSPLLIASKDQLEERDQARHSTSGGKMSARSGLSLSSKPVDLMADQAACQLTSSMENLSVNAVQRRLVYDDTVSIHDNDDEAGSNESSLLESASQQDDSAMVGPGNAAHGSRYSGSTSASKQQQQLDQYVQSLQKMLRDHINLNSTSAESSERSRRQVDEAPMSKHLLYLEQVQQQMMQQHQQQLEELLAQQQQQLVLWQQTVALEQQRMMGKQAPRPASSSSGSSEKKRRKKSSDMQQTLPVTTNGHHHPTSNVSPAAAVTAAHRPSTAPSTHVRFDAHVAVAEVPSSRRQRESYDGRVASAQGSVCIDSSQVLKTKKAASPQQQQPNGILALTVKTIPAELQQRFVKLSAVVKGYLTRRLLASEKVQTIIRTIADTASFALSIQQESPVKKGTAPLPDKHLQQQVLAQLTAAMYEIHEIFFDLPISERMALIEQTRALERERFFKSLNLPASGNKRLSTATTRALERKARSNDKSRSTGNLAQHMSRSKTLPISSAKATNHFAGPDLLFGIKKRKGLSTKMSPASADKENPPPPPTARPAIASNAHTGASKPTKIAYKPLTTGTINSKSKQETLEQSKMQLAAKARKIAVPKTVHTAEH